ncbi:hypothetical protein CRG98_005235 [Punica granatum]|uniref:Uncharacterized protein n=1 Tax=Punica granatum TaxID=22663 RepID=A0A2I0L0W3_PUNGR|nr:hypothetical protein CRG98_005235 [Punica granatum]
MEMLPFASGSVAMVEEEVVMLVVVGAPSSSPMWRCRSRCLGRHVDQTRRGLEVSHANKLPSCRPSRRVNSNSGCSSRVC